MTTTNQTREEISLLLFIETCCVDNYGKINTAHINGEDRIILKKWNASGFVKTGRLPISMICNEKTMWASMSREAIEQAAAGRKARQDRGVPVLLKQFLEHDACVLRDKAVEVLQPIVLQIEKES